MLATLVFALALQAPQVDEKAQAAFDALQAKLAKANSARATLEIRNFGRVDTYEYRFLRPNFAKAVSKESSIFQDGKTYFDYSALDNAYTARPAGEGGLPAGAGFSLGGVTGLESLGFPNEPAWMATAIVRKSYSGVPAHAIQLRGKVDPKLKATLWLAEANGMPIGWDYYLHDFKASGRIKNLALDSSFKPGDFAWQPPKGARKLG